ncbi:MAG: hypothetical protein C0506_09800 [Anaerolinea sp.]|nr:hypothetical protein [Anaerolinea sp.]
MFPVPLAIIALAAVAALLGGPAGPAAAGGGGCQPALADANREAGGDVVALRQACFLPTVLRIEPGTKVTFVNEDEMVHVVASVGMEWGNAGNLNKGMALEATFEKPGIYPYACPLHYGMVGAVVVGDGKFAGTSLGAVKNTHTGFVQDSKAALAQPAPASPALAETAAASDDGRSPWIYAGGGLLAGALFVGAFSAGIASRRP